MSAPRERDNACWRQSTAITNKELPLLTLYQLKAVCACYFRRFMFCRTKIEKVKRSSVLCKKGRTKIIFKQSRKGDGYIIYKYIFLLICLGPAN